MFEYAYDPGSVFPIIQEFDIADATAVSKGEAVRFDAAGATSTGVVVTGGTTYTTAYLGVTAEAKAASDGKTRIKVYCSPTAVFRADPIVTTVTATPSTTVWTDSTVLLNTTADAANGGKLKIKALATGATGTYLPGKVIPIIDSATNTLTGAAASFPGSTTVGDSAYFFPPITATGPNMSATNALTITWAATTGTALKVVDHDLVNNKVLFMFALHQLANKVA
ncbi:MAG: hypothetical protein ACYC4H_00820 [Desulfocucumaceae bacterium]